jgi:hypothetical protein
MHNMERVLGRKTNFFPASSQPTTEHRTLFEFIQLSLSLCQHESFSLFPFFLSTAPGKKSSCRRPQFSCFLVLFAFNIVTVYEMKMNMFANLCYEP